MDELDLLDWKRRVSELYADIRAASDPEAGWRRWCETRRELFRAHPQSPVPAAERDSFGGPFVYQPSCSYDSRWACPLAPPANRLEMRVEAGERLSWPERRRTARPSRARPT